MILLITGTVYGFSFSTDWSDSYSYSHEIIFIDAFDPSGHPFAGLIQNQTSPIIGLVMALFYLVCRCSVFGLIMLLINLITHQVILGFSIAITINYLEANFYKITGIRNLGIMPFEHSIITLISGQRPAIALSLLYWTAFISLLVFLSYLWIDGAVEKLFLNVRHISNNH